MGESKGPPGHFFSGELPDQRRAIEDHLDYATAIKRLREERGMTRQDLALKSGVSYSYLSEVERGAKRPSGDVLAKLAAAMGMLPSDLLRRVEELPRRQVGGVREGKPYTVRRTPEEWPLERYGKPMYLPGRSPLGKPDTGGEALKPGTFFYWHEPPQDAAFSRRPWKPLSYDDILMLWKRLRGSLRSEERAYRALELLLHAVAELDAEDLEILLRLAERLIRRKHEQRRQGK
ncbi:MAG: helix-turn-helix domain-containing protein [Candidatus Binatia bacterium]|nr:helix-turn-helix domain-containing protein [Candidatus Binatia bacterium]